MTIPSNVDQSFLTRIQQALLNDWDPIGVAHYPQAHDEYDAYVPEVWNLLKSAPSLNDIFDYLWDLETGHIGLTGDDEARLRTLRFAQQLMRLSEEMRKM